MSRAIAYGLAGAVALALSLNSAHAQTQPQVRLNMASTFPGSMVLIGDAAKKLGDKVRRASGGQIDIRFNEPGALVPAAQSVDAVSQGSVDAAWAGAGWFAGKDSAFNMFSSVPFGPGARRVSGVDVLRRRPRRPRARCSRNTTSTTSPAR